MGTAFILISTLVYLIGTIFHPLGPENRDTTLIVNQGDSLNRITRKLSQKNVIRSSSVFKWYSIVLNKNRLYKSGVYQIKGRISISQLSTLLAKGSDQLTRITIPEGWSKKEIFNYLDKRGIGDSKRYHKLSVDKNFIRRLNLPVELTTLEGFLFPDTYQFSKTTREKSVLSIMVRNFLKRMPKNYEKMAARVGLDYYQSIILAAIIEKETGAANERTLISSVFHNRLKKKMKLQTDPTVIYGIKNFDGNLTRKLLRKKSPYNTYIIFGLPPTPIANPGLSSIYAAIQPAKTEYLYFVAMGNGQHKFSSNYRDHNQAVTRFQKRRLRNYRSY